MTADSCPLTIEESFVDNKDGWQLHLKVTRSTALNPSLRPLLIVPGYGMNGFIFGYHPRGTSMERHLAEAGFEVWTVNLRNQGPSAPISHDAPPPSLRAFAQTDVAAAVDSVLARSRTHHDRLDAIGASLGGSIVYAHLALCAKHRLHSIITIGAPLRWIRIHPALKLAFRSTRVARMVRMKGTQKLARAALPLIARAAPGLLSIYMNAGQIDLSKASELTRTVDDPHPRVNTDLAKWFRHKDMLLAGVNITEAMSRIEQPLLLVIANRDGIVPPSSALSAQSAWGGSLVETLYVGDEQSWYAHADLFISDAAPQTVFEPMARWLKQHNGTTRENDQ